MRDKIDITFDAISEALYAFDFPEIDLVLGIGRGGVYPACMIAHQLGVAMKIIRVSHRNDLNEPMQDSPKIMDDIKWDFFSYPRILIVDDVAVTGKTLALVKERLIDNEVHTFVLKGTADMVLFPKVKSCVNWPWNNAGK
ncbi:phosphoribosyltransferase [Cyclobacterium plantarum]|uniref:phosphoribosyltransferase n=1 Tax=Cyclobacterium plantarum TaxID=2716263 RepID=UPI003F6E6C06